MAGKEEARQQCLEILRKMLRIVLEDIKDQAEEKHCTFADLIAEARAQGTEITPFAERIILAAESRI